MQITITNLAPVAVPFVSSQAGGIAELLAPNDPATFHDDQLTVAVAGDKPSFIDEVQEALEGIADVIKRIITFWRERAAQDDVEAANVVNVRITNQGSNGLRVILGDNTNDYTVQPGDVYDASAPGFVEIRELGV